MNYRHAFHAGGFSDVFKHLVLVLLTDYVMQKPKPICYLDTHSGPAIYDLSAEPSQKTNEADLGIKRIYGQKDLPVQIKRYLEIIGTFNRDFGAETLRYYPGSPSIMRQLIREQDRMILNELHPEDYEFLKELFSQDPQVAVHKLDAYHSLKAFLPPIERRGITLIDAAFEVKDEYQIIIEGVKEALKRFETGVYAIWYPIKNKAVVNDFIKKLKAMSNGKFLNAIIQPYADDFAFGLNACGMAVINPPYQLEAQLNECLPWLWKMLSPHGQGSFLID